MTGTEDGFDTGGWDVAEVLWSPGVDYLEAWRGARDSADALNSVLRRCGLDADAARAVAVSGADGSASVSIRLSADAARRVADLMHRGRTAA